MNPDPATQASRAFGQTLGEGARTEGGINKIRPWGGPFHSGHGIKCKISWPRALCDADFYVKINPRQKSGNAVACTSVAPMQLHCPICHAGISIQVIIAQQRKNGGGGLITLLAFGRSLPTSPI